MKYIPGEIVAAYVSITAIIESASKIPSWISWLVFGVLWVATPFFYWKVTQDSPKQTPAIRQAVISTVAFFVWVFALGGPFLQLSWYLTAYGGILLVLFTTFVPLFVSPSPSNQPAEPVASAVPG